MLSLGLILTLGCLAFTGTTLAESDQLPFLPNFSKGTAFPAGLPTFSPIYKVPPFVEPPLPENAYRGVYGHTTCATTFLVRPSSTSELASAIKDIRAKAAAQNRPVKMRAARQGFATMSSFPCSGQPTLVAPYTVDGKEPVVAGLLMDKMTQVLEVDKENHRLRVQGQMKLKGLYEAADANGMSTPRSALPWWQGLTLAGVFATTSHGTGNNVTSMICDWFIDVTWVSANGTIHVSKKGTDEAVALCGGLGLLGAITEFNLQLTPTSKTKFSTWYLKDDSNLAADVEEMLKITPHLVVMWRPDIKKYTGHLQQPAADDAVAIPGAQCNVIPQQIPAQAALTGPQLRAWQNDPFNKGATYFVAFDSPMCMLGLTGAVGATWVTKPGKGSAVGIPTPLFEGVAPTNHVTSTECGDNCAFTSKNLMATALDVEFAIERSKLAEWIQDIRTLIAKDLRGLPGWGAHTRCLLPGYYVMRFGKTPKSLVGNAAGLKQPVYLQQQMLASKATPGVPSRYEWIQEAYEQLTLCKYDGRPHTGKNWDRTFTNPRCPLAAKYGDNLKKMTKMQDKYDPERVFEPQLWARVVAGDGYQLKPKCQLDRSCYCEKDEHCADGFVCVPSVAFPEYKGCRPRVMN